MKRVVTITVVMCSLAAAAGLALWQSGNVGANRLETMLGGKVVVETIARPDRVDAYLLEPYDFTGSFKQSTVADFPVATGPTEVSRETSARISAALLADDSYGWEYAKYCVPRYGVRLSYVREADRVDILFCFECETFVVFHNDRVSGGEDFDPARPVLVKALKTIFPRENVIKRLKEHGGR